MKKITVLLSGGIDSVTCLNLLINDDYTCDAIFIDYGQPSAAYEIDHAKKASKYYNIPLQILSVKSDTLFEEGEIQGRNLFLISCALMHFKHIKMIAIGIHSGTSYYDCSSDFLHLIKTMVANCTRGKVGVIAPLLNWDKNQIINYASAERIPLSELTYSCEKGIEHGCQTCLSCKDRETIDASKKKMY